VRSGPGAPGASAASVAAVASRRGPATSRQPPSQREASKGTHISAALISRKSGAPACPRFLRASPPHHHRKCAHGVVGANSVVAVLNVEVERRKGNVPRVLTAMVTIAMAPTQSRMISLVTHSPVLHRQPRHHQPQPRHQPLYHTLTEAFRMRAVAEGKGRKIGVRSGLGLLGVNAAQDVGRVIKCGSVTSRPPL